MGRLANLKNALDTARRVAYHGSPHDFDKFSLAKIGTGEGAQVYGHGLYFSSSKDIATFYRDQLSARGIHGDPSTAKRILSENGGDKAAALAQLNRMASEVDGTHRQMYYDTINNFDELLKDDRGRLYTVEIPDESLMLDWDKPLSEQPEGVRAALQRAGLYDPDADSRAQEIIAEMDRLAKDRLPNNQMREEKRWLELAKERDAAIAQSGSTVTGQKLYRGMDWDMRPDSPEASAKLRELGIPGITYKGATSDERNFVVFDDELVNILEKGNATPGGMATAGGLAAGAEFARRRANKTQTLKGLGETALTVGSGLLGGFIGDLSRLGGYLNPFMSVEDTERGAEALSGSMQYIPSGAATPYLDRVSQGLEQAEKEAAWAAGELGWENSIPNKIYQALPERAQGIIDTTLL